MRLTVPILMALAIATPVSAQEPGEAGSVVIRQGRPPIEAGEMYAARALAAARAGEDARPLWDQALAIFLANEDWRRAATAAGGAALDRGNRSDWIEALRLARLAVELGDRSGDAATQGYALRVLGVTLNEQGDHAGAEAALERALVLLGGPTGDGAAPVLDELGPVYQETQRYDRAAVVLAQAIVLKERLNGPDSYPVALSLNALGSLRAAQERPAEAEALYRRALRIAEANGRTAAAAAIRSNLGWAIQQQGRHAEAEPLLRQAAEAVEASLGREHEDSASAWANLAGNLQDQGRHAEAAAILRDAVARYEAAVGRDHLLTAWSLNALARSVAVLEGEAAAGPLYAEALAISEARLSPGHPDRVRRANDMAEHLFLSDRPKAAMTLARATGRDVRARLDTARLGGESAPALDRGRRVFGLQVRGAWTLAQ